MPSARVLLIGPLKWFTYPIRLAGYQTLTRLNGVMPAKRPEATPTMVIGRPFR